MQHNDTIITDPSGLRLQSLLQKEIKSILKKEVGNLDTMYLYGTGTHWVAFENSAYQLCQQCEEVELTPFFFDDYPFPVLMASISYFALEDKTISDRMTLTVPKLNQRRYNVWHRKVIKQYEDVFQS